jgi:hypothetical protein
MKLLGLSQRIVTVFAYCTLVQQTMTEDDGPNSITCRKLKEVQMTSSLLRVTLVKEHEYV